MTKKLFTSELRRIRTQGDAGSGDDAGGIGDILRAIGALSADVNDIGALLRQVYNPPPPPPPTEADTAEKLQKEASELEQRRSEIMLLKTELRGLANSINQTKSEIAALRPANSEIDRLLVVSNELDAVVTATEGATQTILDAVEHVDSLATAIQSQVGETHVGQLADEIKERVITIFEACNFQDITGQRINKVVNTLKYIEERVENMIEIWGRDSFGELPAPQTEVASEDDEAKLLNGPQLEAISQDDIDKLFGG